MNYLLKHGKQNTAMKIHKINFSARLITVIVDAINNFTKWIIDSETISICYKWFHPYRIRFSTTRTRCRGGGGFAGIHLGHIVKEMILCYYMILKKQINFVYIEGIIWTRWCSHNFDHVQMCGYCMLGILVKRAWNNNNTKNQ